MKIIKQGQLPEEKVYSATCYYCKTEVEFSRKEGKVTYDQRNGNSVSVNCPLCGKLIDVDL